MKKFITFIFLLSLLSTFIVNPTKVIAVDSITLDVVIDNTSNSELIKSFLITEDFGSSSLKYEINEAGNYGPESFWIDNDGSIFVLDTLNTRIVSFINGDIKHIQLNESIYPTDIIHNDNYFYILDTFSDNKLLVYDDNGLYLASLDLSQFDMHPRNLSKSNNNIIVKSSEQNMDVQVIYRNNELNFIENANTNVLNKTKLNNVDFSQQIDNDNNELTYALNTKLVPNCSIIAGELVVSCTNKSQNELGNYIIPTDEFSYIPENFIRIVNNKIYLMVPTSNAIEIRVVSLGKLNKSNMNEISKNALQLQEAYSSSNDRRVLERASVISLTRSEVLDRANRMATYTWTLTSKNININSVPSASQKDVILPYYIRQLISAGKLDNGGSVSMSGIPYCWGGFMSQYSKTSSYSFDDAISKGYYAGNVSGSSSGYVSGTAGLDCSGFVSAAYGLSSKKGTSNSQGKQDGLVSFGSAISNINSLGQMDFLVKDGHTLLFYQWMNQSTGDMLIIEANSTNETGKTIVRIVNINDYIKASSPWQMRTPW